MELFEETPSLNGILLKFVKILLHYCTYFDQYFKV